MSLTAVQKNEIFNGFKERLGNVLREITVVHEEADALLESKEITQEEFNSFATQVEEVFEKIVTEAEYKQEQKKKLKDAIDPFASSKKK